MHLTISSNLDEFTLRGTFMANCESVRDEIYLFLLPPVVDASGGHLTVHVPPANERHYWSFDPEGSGCLSQEALEELALPTVHFKVRASGAHRTQQQYNVIADFHRAKGFDPTSQDVALELGYPLVDVDRLNSLINGDKVYSLILIIIHRKSDL
jgi:hypothetical protein